MLYQGMASTIRRSTHTSYLHIVKDLHPTRRVLSSKTAAPCVEERIIEGCQQVSTATPEVFY